MKIKLQYLWEILKASFWFLPMIIVLAAILLASGLTFLDTRIDFGVSGFIHFLFVSSPDSARSMLSMIAGSMLGIAGTVFSITLVALTLASSQFGARILHNFMLDRLNQTVLGVYVATFIYCLIVLRTIQAGPEPFVPNLAVLFAILVSIANIFLLVVFFHHISVSIQADQVISEINSKLSRQLMTLFPDKLGEEREAEKEKQFQEIGPTFSVRETIRSTSNGYLQTINSNGLMSVAKKNDLLLESSWQPGDFLVEGVDLITVYSNERCSKDIRNHLLSFFILGHKRTPIQDTEFAIHQMVEIAARALSPGVNDPYTAITCIDKLTATMCQLSRVQFPSAYRFDDEGALRIVVKPRTFTGVMDAAFNQIRQYGAGNPSVLIRLMEGLLTIRSFTQTKEQRKAVEKHAKMVYNAARQSLSETNDLQDMKDRFDKMEIE